MKQYIDLIKKISENGVEKESGRANMPNVIGINGSMMEMDLNDGFPLLTTKKMFWRGIIHELIWIIGGKTNIKYLVDNDVNIWNGDAYRWYQKKCELYGISPYFTDINDFISFIKDYDIRKIYETKLLVELSANKPELRSHLLDLRKHDYMIGDLGKVYGHQWRNQNGVDQLKDIITGLQTNPFSRYHILNAWHKADFYDMALPPCHILYHFMVRPLSKKDKVDWLNSNCLMYDDRPWTIENFDTTGTEEELTRRYDIPKFYLDLLMYQRSCDLFLGVPFNIASMSAFLMIMAKITGMAPGVAKWVGGDIHLYKAHISAAQEQIERQPYELPKLIIKKNLKTLNDIESLTINDFDVIGYHYHPAIKQELFTGYKR